MRRDEDDEFRRYCRNIMIILCIAALALPLFGCAPKTVEKVRTEIIEVKVPMRCDIDWPPRPAAGADALETELLLHEYIQLLEAALRKCE